MDAIHRVLAHVVPIALALRALWAVGTIIRQKSLPANRLIGTVSIALLDIQVLAGMIWLFSGAQFSWLHLLPATIAAILLHAANAYDRRNQKTSLLGASLSVLGLILTVLAPLLLY